MLNHKSNRMVENIRVGTTNKLLENLSQNSNKLQFNTEKNIFYVNFTSMTLGFLHDVI